jgi:transcriptional regulator with XRE-family HTH domain
MAAATGMEANSLRRIENSRTNPTVKTLLKPAKALGDFSFRTGEVQITETGLRNGTEISFRRRYLTFSNTDRARTMQK